MFEGAKSMGAGATIGIGNVVRSLIHSVARNPSLAKQLFGYAIFVITFRVRGTIAVEFINSIQG